MQLFYHKKIAHTIAVVFYKNSLIVAWYTFRSKKIIDQPNDIFTLVRHNCNHQEGFLKQKHFVLHRCIFKLKLPKHFYFGQNIDYWKLGEYCVKLLCVNLIPIVKLLFHSSPTRKLLFYTTFSLHKLFDENSITVACCTFGRLEIRTLTPNGFKSETNDTKTFWPQLQP